MDEFLFFNDIHECSSLILKKRIVLCKITSLYIFMLFLHLETHKFCKNILYYDFHVDSIEILWYWKFAVTIIGIIYWHVTLDLFLD